MKSSAILLCLLFTVSAHAQRSGNPLFSRYPFDDWAAETQSPEFAGKSNSKPRVSRRTSAFPRASASVWTIPN